MDFFKKGKEGGKKWGMERKFYSCCNKNILGAEKLKLFLKKLHFLVKISNFSVKFCWNNITVVINLNQLKQINRLEQMI